MKLALLLALLLLSLAGAGPRIRTRSVSGVVADRFGNALRGAAVEIENTRSLAVGSYITRDDGRYYFHQLSSDVDFTLRAKYRNLWSKPKTLSKFNEEPNVTIDLEIPTG